MSYGSTNFSWACIVGLFFLFFYCLKLGCLQGRCLIRASFTIICCFARLKNKRPGFTVDSGKGSLYWGLATDALVMPRWCWLVLFLLSTWVAVLFLLSIWVVEHATVHHWWHTTRTSFVGSQSAQFPVNSEKCTVGPSISLDVTGSSQDSPVFPAEYQMYGSPCWSSLARQNVYAVLLHGGKLFQYQAPTQSWNGKL